VLLKTKGELLNNEIIRVRYYADIIIFFKIFLTMKTYYFGNLVDLRFNMSEGIRYKMNLPRLENLINRPIFLYT
jgi:hypothetical protein